MSDSTARALLSSVTPFFIVRKLARAVAFYRDGLDFEVTFQSPEPEPFFAIVRRDGASFMLKEIAPEVAPMPNATRHAWASWDAFIHTQDPDALAAESAARHVVFEAPLADTADGLRGFSVRDHDGYTLFFGRPC